MSGGMGKLTPSQKALGKFFALVGLLFLGQALVGGALAHYRVESTFYGFPIASILPYNLMRTWHLQLAIFWIATAWVAGGLFIAPILSGKEPKHQKLGVNIFFIALAVVVVGSLTGEFLSSQGFFKDLWFWFGNQGSEYLDLGRFWQYLLIIGFLFWLVLLFRGLDPFNRASKNRELLILFFIAGAAIPFFYIPAIFYCFCKFYVTFRTRTPPIKHIIKCNDAGFIRSKLVYKICKNSSPFIPESYARIYIYID